MAHVSRFTRCTAQMNDGTFCDRRGIPDAPFPICVRHLGQAASFLLSVAPDAMTALQISAETFDPSEAKRNARRYSPTVYYLLVGDTIKIGYTSDLHSRMATYPPFSRLLATERGRQCVEQRRHQQFADARAHGREWFRPTAELISHINSLRETPLTAAELAA